MLATSEQHAQACIEHRARASCSSIAQAMPYVRTQRNSRTSFPDLGRNLTLGNARTRVARFIHSQHRNRVTAGAARGQWRCPDCPGLGTAMCCGWGFQNGNRDV